jgi:2-oxoglutarate ferredoxin oxidoreductase subunit delta
VDKVKYWRKPLDEAKVKQPLGKIYVKEDRCKGCTFCVEYCPKGVLAMSERFNNKGYHFPYAAMPEDCVDCKLCQRICPEFSIFCVSQNGGRDMA